MADVQGPTAESIAAAKRELARERRAVEKATGMRFIGDRLVSRADEYDRLAEILAAGILRATARLN